MSCNRISEEEKKPGNIVSNDGSETAVDLGAQTKVSGDVRAVGRVNLYDGAVVQGEIKEEQSAQNLPRINLSVYDPREGEQSYVPFTSAMTEIRDGRALHEGGPLTLGDLRLDNGLLFVDGDLTITGKVMGKARAPLCARVR